MDEEKIFEWTISFAEVNEIIKDSKFNFLNYKAFINEDIFYKEIESRNDVKYEFSQIENWMRFQLDIEDLTQEHFCNSFLENTSPDELVLLFTDEGGFNKFLYKDLRRTHD